MKQLSEEEIEFLRESNAIEREYSDIALEDAKDAWALAKRHKGPITLDVIKKIHRQLMKTLNPRIAGNFRKIQVGVQTSKGFREGVQWQYIEKVLDDLCSSFNNLDNNISRNILNSIIKIWHVEFEKIHPFEDGNGRTGRILMNLQRLRLGLPILIIHEGKEQFEYYKWFKVKEQ